MDWKKNVRLITLIILVLVSSSLILYPEFSKSSGVVVTSVGIDSACRDIITTGSTIREITGKPISNSRDFERVTKDLEGPITFIINNNPRSCTIPENSSLDVAVRDIKTKGLRFGIDVGGGKYYSFKPENEENTEETYAIIELRVKNYELSNTRVEIEDGKINILTDSEEYVDHLTERGILEGRLIKEIKLSGKGGYFDLNDKEYEITLKNDESISINGTNYGVGQTFEIENLKFKVENVSKNATTVSSIIFDNDDLSLLESPGTSPVRIMKRGNGYVFVVSTVLSDEASENFARITEGEEVQVDPSTGESYSKNPLMISIDDEIFVELPILGTDLGKKIGQLNIWGFRSTEQKASNDLLRLKTLIEFKELPTDLVLKEKGAYSPPKGEFYITLPIYTILVFYVSGAVFFFVRYRKRGVTILPLILLTLSSIPLILGTMVHSWLIVLFFLSGITLVLMKGEVKDWKNWSVIFLMFVMVVGIVMSKWVVDVSSIIGLAIVVPFILIQGVLAGDKFLSGEEFYTRTGFKDSLSWSWATSAIVLLISIPLFFLSDFFKGLSMTISVGVLLSTTLIIPTYGRVIKKVSRE